MKDSKGYLKEFTKGLVKENPNFVMLLGMCPTLAITTMAVNGLGMGLATTFVLLFSNVMLSLLRKTIPAQVRLPAFIVIIAGFTTLTGFLLEAFVPSLYEALGLYLSLITVNCIIFGRAEAFASRNPVLPSLLDALGMGAGFTGALLIIGSIREILGAGTWFGIRVLYGMKPMTLMILPAGGFLVLGTAIAVIGVLTKKRPKESFGCDGCPAAEGCHGCSGGEGKEGAK